MNIKELEQRVLTLELENERRLIEIKGTLGALKKLTALITGGTKKVDK